MSYGYGYGWIEKELDMNFEDFIKNYVNQKLDSLEGREVYGCDLACELTMEDNVNGSHFIWTQADEEFIKKHWDEAADTHEYLNDELGMVVNPFDKPSQFAFCMIDKGVADMLSGSSMVDELWDEKVVFTEELIATIKDELDIDTRKLEELAKINVETEQAEETVKASESSTRLIRHVKELMQTEEKVTKIHVELVDGYGYDSLKYADLLGLVNLLKLSLI